MQLPPAGQHARWSGDSPSRLHTAARSIERPREGLEKIGNRDAAKPDVLRSRACLAPPSTGRLDRVEAETSRQRGAALPSVAHDHIGKKVVTVAG